MPYASLADFLAELEQQGELVRVRAEVDAALEISEITRRVARAGGPALVFERVRGQTAPVVTNLLGTTNRVCQALGVESLDSIVTRAESLVAEHTPQNWFDRLKTAPADAGVNKFRAKSVKAGASQQVVRLGRDIDLAQLPLLKSWPDESGAAITAGIVVTRDQSDDSHRSTVCPLQALDGERLAVLDDGDSHFSRQWAEHRASGEKLPVAVVMGGDPGWFVAAHLAPSETADAYHLWGLLRGKPVDLVRCRSHLVEVPADADFVFEGYLDPQAAPVSVVTSTVAAARYRTAGAAPVIQLTAITHRGQGIFPALVDDAERGESGALVQARERLMFERVRGIVPDLVDLHLPPVGGEHGWALAAIGKRYPFHARQIASALWGTAALRFSRFLVLVDAGIDLRDARAVCREVGANVAIDRDIFSYDGPAHSVSSLGPAAIERHLGIDATTKIAGERDGTPPARLRPSDEVQQRVAARWSEFQLGALGRAEGP